VEKKIWGTKLGLGLAVVAAFMLLLAPGVAPAAEKIAVGTVYPGNMDDNEIFPALKFFGNLLAEKSNGHYQLEIFPGGQLGSEVEVTRECQTGVTAQMSIASSGAFSSFFKKYQAIVAPYLFPDRMTAWAFFDSDFFAEFMSELPKIGLRYLATMSDGGGFVALTNSARPVNTPADLKGLRIRTEENPAHMAIMNAMGAAATPMAWGEVATALATKTADGQFNGPGIAVWAKLWETQKYLTLLNHIYNTNTWVVSEKWFKDQSPENQALIIECARAAVIYSRGIACHLNELALDTVRKHGMEVNFITAENMAKFKEMAQAGYRKWAVDDFGLSAEMLDEVNKNVAEAGENMRSTLVGRYGK